MRAQEKGQMPLISVVIVNRNGERFINPLLTSLFATENFHFEIVFVDNGSEDKSVEMVSKFEGKGRIKTIALKENIGWSPANNLGVKFASGDIIVFLSNDMEVDKEWLSQILKILDRSDAGVVQCNSLSVFDRHTHDSAMNFLDRFGYAYSYFYDTPKETEVFFAEGMAFAVRRNVIGEIGLLDPYYFMEYDDMDFSWRARLAGYKVFFAPRSLVYHARGGYSGSTIFIRRTQNIFTYTRNHIVTLVKNYSLRNLALALPIVLFGNAFKTLVFLLKRNPRAIAVLRAHHALLADFKRIWKARLEVQTRLRKVEDRKIFNAMVPFSPAVQLLFLARQSSGRKLILRGAPKNGEKSIHASHQ